MGKGIFKGFKGMKYISQIFVYKEHEMEIGFPTDVKHVAHVGWDGTSANPPSWMSEFKTASNFQSTSVSNMNQSRQSNGVAVASWTSQDFQESNGVEPASMFADVPPPDLPKARKKTKWKKTKDSPSGSSSSSSRAASETSKPKSPYPLVETAGISPPLALGVTTI